MAVTSETGLDTVTNVLEILVSEFGAQLCPFATQLCSELVNQLDKLITQEPEEDLEEMEEKSLAAIGVCNSITALVRSLESSPHIILQIEPIICPALEFILSKNTVDIMEEALELLLALVGRSQHISERLFVLFPILHDCLLKNALDFATVFPVLNCYAGYGMSIYSQSKSLVGLFFEISTFIIGSSYSTDEEKKWSCNLIESVLQRSKRQADQVISFNQFILPLLELAWSMQRDYESTSTSLHTQFLKIVLNCIYYDARMVKSHLDRKLLTAPLVETITRSSKHFTSLHNRRLLVNATMLICDIFSAEGGDTSTVKASVVSLVTTSLSIISKILELEATSPSTSQIVESSVNMGSPILEDASWDETASDVDSIIPTPSDAENAVDQFAESLNKMISQGAFNPNLLSSTDQTLLKKIFEISEQSCGSVSMLDSY